MLFSSTAGVKDPVGALRRERAHNRLNVRMVLHSPCGGCSSVGSSARLWFWKSWVQAPPAAPKSLTSLHYRKAGSGNPEKFPRFGKTAPSLVESTPNQVASVAPY